MHAARPESWAREEKECHSHKDWYEATNVCAKENKVLCGVEQPCKNRGCSYNNHYQWTGQECQAGDEGLPAACASA